MKIDIHEMKLRILGEFDDTDMYDIYSVMNSVIRPFGDLTNLATFRAAVTELVASRVAVLGFQIKSFVPETVLDGDGSLELVSHLSDWFKFDQEKKAWIRSIGVFGVDPIPFIMLTEEGKDQALEVRKHYAFRWWEKVAPAGGR